MNELDFYTHTKTKSFFWLCDNHYEPRESQHIRFEISQETDEKEVEFLKKHVAKIIKCPGASVSGHEIRFIDSVHKCNSNCTLCLV